MELAELGQWFAIGGGVVGVTVWAIRLEGLVRQNKDRLDRGDARFDAHAEKDDAVLRALNELRVAVARLEEKIDRRGNGN